MDCTMNPIANFRAALTRRTFLARGGLNFGAVALGSLLDDGGRAAVSPFAVRPPHFAAKAKRVIYLHMVGAPSQLDLFDYKPAAGEVRGQAAAADLSSKGSARLHPAEADARSARASSSPSTAERRRSCRSCCRTWRGWSTTSAIVKSMHTDAVQPRAGPALLEHRLRPAGPAEPRLVGDLRAGHGEPGPAGVRGVALRPAAGRAAARPAGRAASCRASTRASSSAPGRPGAVSLQPRRAWTAAIGSASLDAVAALNQAQLDDGRRSGDRHAHQPVRDGVPHADVACRS